MSAPVLPAALRPLARELEGLDPAVIAALAPLLLRTLAVLSTTAPPTSDDDGAPDGYSGFARRGPWDRLTMSEWALLDEVPDEFLRRVAANEQLFHELERTAPKRPGVVVALFDVGGDQLGRPKLVQLAVAIVLAARARDNGATFLFGPLSSKTTLEPWSARALLHLRDSRARRNVDDDDSAPARRAVDAVVCAPGSSREVVIVGGEGTARGAWPQALHVFLDDVLEPETRAVTLRIEQRGTPRTATLPLPDDAICTRVMRDPLVQRTPKPQTTTTTKAPVRERTRRVRFRKSDDTAIDGTAPVCMSADGSRVMARLVDGGVLSLGLQNRAARSSAELSWGRSLWVPDTVVAAGAASTQLWAITVGDGGEGCDVHTGNGGSVHLQATVQPTPRSDGAFCIAAQHTNQTTKHTDFWFVDGDRRLFHCDMRHRRLRLVEDGATILYSSMSTLRYATDRRVAAGHDIEIVVVTATGARDIVLRDTLPGTLVKLVDVGHEGVRVLGHVEARRWRLWNVGVPGLLGTRTAAPTVEVTIDAPAPQIVGVFADQDRFVAVTTLHNGVIVHTEQPKTIDVVVQACVARRARVPMVVTLDPDGALFGHPLHDPAGRWRLRDRPRVNG